MNKRRLTAALELIGVLAERFPACFAINPSYRRPLKLNIHVDILAQLGDTIAPRDLSDALRTYVRNPRYLKALVVGAKRVDLNGMHAGTVTAEPADIAKQRREKRGARQQQAAIAAPRRSSLADLRMAAQARRVP